MFENSQTDINEFKKLFKNLDRNQQADIAAQLFLEYCIYQDQCENTKRLAPLINTVAEALTKNIKDEGSLRLGIKAVQMYLRTPPVEYFGETLSRLGFLDQQSVDEMLQIKPNIIIFGDFLIDQGLLTKQQKDIAVMAQKRLFTIQEVHEKILNKDFKENRADVVQSLKDVFRHFLISTSELEDDLKQSKNENVLYTLNRLENIITETEKHSHFVLGIVDHIFTLREELKGYVEEIKAHTDQTDKFIPDCLQKISDRLNLLNSLNLELNSSQQIQDRIGQQMLKIISSIQTFHDQLLKIANRLNLKWENIETQEADLTNLGYSGTESEERLQQDYVDDLLSNLGL